MRNSTVIYSKASGIVESLFLRPLPCSCSHLGIRARLCVGLRCCMLRGVQVLLIPLQNTGVLSNQKC